MINWKKKMEDKILGLIYVLSLNFLGGTQENYKQHNFSYCCYSNLEPRRQILGLIYALSLNFLGGTRLRETPSMSQNSLDFVVFLSVSSH
jgi:hypothetical protein